MLPWTTDDNIWLLAVLGNWHVVPLIPREEVSDDGGALQELLLASRELVVMSWSSMTASLQCFALFSSIRTSLQ